MRWRFAAGLVAGVLFASAAWGQGPGPRGLVMPEPPRQKAAWEAPRTSVPRYVVEAAQALFAQGLADPRGCSYREIVPDCAANRQPRKEFRLPEMHGWVLPAADNDAPDAPRFAVCWNGLVYPLLSAGPAADVAADVDAMLVQHEKTRAQAQKDSPRGPVFLGFRFNDAWNHYTAAGLPWPMPMQVCLLLRLGRADLAERVWAAGTEGRPAAAAAGAGEERPELSRSDVNYLTLATDWAWALFDRAVNAHAAGDDALALASARAVAKLHPELELKAARLGFEPLPMLDNTDRVRPYIEFLGQIDALVSDQERRAGEPRRAPALERGRAAFANRAAWIQALVDDLDQVHEQQWSQPGSVDLAGAPVVQALIQEGDAAVEPLLACVERDDRLTRSVQYWRNFQRQREVLPVSRAAYAAVVTILRTSAFGANVSSADLYQGKAGRQRLAAGMRAYWQKNRGVSLAERWYRTLADDHATPAEWLTAAGNIVRPGDVEVRPGGFSVTPHRPGGTPPPLAGEALRTRKSPSVAELMAKRVEAIDPSDAPLTPSLTVPEGGSGAIFAVLSANDLAGMLARWDLHASVPTLRARVGRSRAIITATKGRGLHEQRLKTDLAGFTTQRLKAGDAKALDDYADWVRTLLPNDGDPFASEVFEPMWRHADHPAIAASAKALFDNPRSPWVPLFRPRERGWAELGQRSDLIASPLLGVPAFRKLVRAGLADRSATGTIAADADGKIAVTVDEGWTTFPAPAADDPLRPRPGTTDPLRLCDLYAWKLSQVNGFPKVELFWPEHERDSSVTAAAKVLDQYGPRLAFVDAVQALYASASFYPQHQRAIFAFERLERPAAREDVRTGRAIFSLEGQGERRAVPLTKYPVAANWLTLRDDPRESTTFDPKTRETTRSITFNQGGLVWQAEEVRAGDDDAWTRYYGIVSRFHIARAPAAEVEFPAPWNAGWQRLSDDLDARLAAPGDVADERSLIPRPAPLDAPLPVTLWLRNRKGLDRNAAADLWRGGDAPSLREGVVIQLQRSREDAHARAARPDDPQVEPTWVDIPMKSIQRHPRGERSQTLAPAEQCEALRLDLRTLFAIDQAGRYRVRVSFGEGEGEGEIERVFLVVMGKGS